MKWVKEVKYIVMNENETLGGEHKMEYTDIKLQCCIPKIYIM